MGVGGLKVVHFRRWRNGGRRVGVVLGPGKREGRVRSAEWVVFEQELRKLLIFINYILPYVYFS